MSEKTLSTKEGEIEAQTRRYWVEYYDGSERPSRKWGYVDSDEHIENLCDYFRNNANIAAWGFTNKLEGSV